MIKNYFVPTFFNGDKILRYLEIISREPVDLIISDYNINASIAAAIANKKTVFVTERHNFTLVDVEINDLKDGGFEVNDDEIEKAKFVLNKMFMWLLNNTELLITDKPLLSEMDSDKTIQEYFKNKKAHFVGPIYSHRDLGGINLRKYNINPDHPYIVGTLSSTTMLRENRENNIDIYVNTFKEVKKRIPNLQMVLIGNMHVEEKDVSVIPYVPDWANLITRSKLLISHPGWITVTEVAKLNVPTLFYLPNFMEYHEVEAYRRLECLGLPVFSGENTEAFAEKILSVIKSESDFFKKGYEILCPCEDGLEKAVSLIQSCLVDNNRNDNDPQDIIDFVSPIMITR